MLRKLLIRMSAFVLSAAVLFSVTIASNALAFSDVPETAWYYDAVNLLDQKGLQPGFGDGSYRPDLTLTKGEMLRLLASAVIPDWTDGRGATSYYYAAYEKRLILSGEFPEDKLNTAISRYDAVLLLVRALENVLGEKIDVTAGISSRIADNSEIPEKYLHAVHAAYSAGLVSGVPGGKFSGNDNVSRATGAVLLQHLIQPTSRNPVTEVAPATPAAIPEAAESPKPTPAPTPVPTPEPTPIVVNDDWFADAAFIGDSLTHGLYLYGRFSTPTYYYSTGMSIFRVGKDIFSSPGKGDGLSLAKQLPFGNYKKLYVLLGINELGSYVGDYKESYGIFIESLKTYCPGATIYVQSVLPVSKNKDASGGAFTKAKVQSFNEALRELAAAKNVRFVDVNSILSDEEGYLPENYTWDGVHLNNAQ
ncbi:MAG: S-layer homology domain-containing protein, partial [Oscillospiraceae bacterium]|nr:S-layer homology domain-containing protein [Oscillospiraceae bacterium]